MRIFLVIPFTKEFNDISQLVRQAIEEGNHELVRMDEMMATGRIVDQIHDEIKKARPMKKEWVNDIRKQCVDYEVPFFFKQWGKPHFNADQSNPTIEKEHPLHAKGGCQLEGQVYREMPLCAIG